MLGFGSLLKDYLDYYKISRINFAKSLGISKKELNDILSGKTNINNDLIENISLITNIDKKLIIFAEKQRIVHNYLYNNFKDDKSINEYLNTYHFDDLVNKGLLKLRNSTNIVQNTIDLFEYLNSN